MTKDGNMVDRAGVGKLADKAVGSLSIRRNRVVPQSERDAAARAAADAAEWGDGDASAASSAKSAFAEEEFEEYMNENVLRGLVPGALVEQYQFWRTGQRVIRGYPRPDSKSVDPNTSLLIHLSIQISLNSNASINSQTRT